VNRIAFSALAAFAFSTGADAAPVPREPIDPKAVALPAKAFLWFTQGKWRIFRSETPTYLEATDKTKACTVRYYLAPLGVESGRLIYEAECARFGGWQPVWVAEDRSVLFRSGSVHAWYDPKKVPLALTGGEKGLGQIKIPGTEGGAHIHVANELGAVVSASVQLEGPYYSEPLFFVPLDGKEFLPEKAVRLSDHYTHSFEWNIKIDGHRVAWGEGVYDTKAKDKWSPLPAKRKPELRALSGDTAVYEALADKGEAGDKELIAFDLATHKVLSAGPRKPNELLVVARDRTGLFFRATGAGTEWEVFARDLADSKAKELFAAPIGKLDSVPKYFITREGVQFFQGDRIKAVGWNTKSEK